MVPDGNPINIAQKHLTMRNPLENKRETDAEENHELRARFE